MVTKNARIVYCDKCGETLSSTVNDNIHECYSCIYHGVTWDHNLKLHSVKSPQSQTGGLVDLCKKCFITFLLDYVKELKKEK